MKKIFVIFLALLLLGIGFGGFYFLFYEGGIDLLTGKVGTPETKETSLEQSSPSLKEDPLESELNALLRDYNVRKTDIGYLHLLAEKYLERRQVKKAKQYLTEALELNTGNVRTQSLLAKIALLQKDYGQAANFLAELPDDDMHVAFVRALLSVLEGDRDMAGKYLHFVSDNFPESELGNKAQRIIDAYREFDYYKDGLPVHLKTLLARSLNQINEPALAIWLLRDVLTEKTDYRDAWILLGYAYYNLQQFSLAEDAFYKAYELDTEKPETQYFLGLTYYALDNPNESERFFEYAVINGFEPRAQVYQKLSEVYLLNQNYKKAVSMYENYLALTPTAAAGDFTRPVQIYIDYLNEPTKALDLAKRIVALQPEDAMSYNLLGLAYLANKDYTNALVSLEKARVLDATLPALHLTFGKFYEAQGEIEKAKEQYKLAYEKGQDQTVSNQAAELYNSLIGND